ncbi:hypothetical protein NIES2100_31420 [Calothrix sp. NIES-2100]|uniref:hypothetical protein n=1 Tax=Calothrix sp. NIES-2100 TaxID=1954172 RepID=UPI000B610FAB|nr:hypothetical protein NIES2100_31420 [Calothrix sp. NIES-2100]
MTTTDQLWQIYASQLKQLVTSGQLATTGQVLSLAGTTLVVDLANSNSNVINDIVYQIGNTIPAWSSTYSNNSSSLLDSYTVFLDSIDLKGDPNPNLDSQINLAAAALTNAQKNFTQVQNEAFTAYSNYKATLGSDITFPQFVQAQYPTYISAKSALSAAVSQYQGLQIQKYGEGYQLIATARNAVGPTGGASDITMQTPYNMTVATGATAPSGSGNSVLPGQTPSSPSSSLVSSFAPAFTLTGFTTKYQEWQTASVYKRIAGTITVTENSQASQWSEFGWGTSANARFGSFFSVMASGQASGQAQNYDWQHEDFSFSVSFTGLGTFLISPGQWFSSGIIKTYHNQLRANSPDFFGEGGSLSLLPQSVIVGFEPQIKLTLSQADYQSAKSSFQASATASIGVGPFQFGSATFSTNGSKSNISYDDNSNSITMGGNSTLPILLGVISNKL